MTDVLPPLLAPIFLRRATADDGPAMHAMLSRCSSDTLRSRFLATTATEHVDELAELVGDMNAATALELYVDTIVRNSDQITVLAWQSNRILAAGSILPTSSATAEIALIVEDLWQGQGLGSLIAAILAEVVTLVGLDYLCAYIGTGNARARALIRRFCPPARFLYPENGVVDVVIPVASISSEVCDQHHVDADGTWSR